MSDTPRAPIEYLINAMERAGMEDNPAQHGYGEKRRKVFAAIVALRAERDAALQRAEDAEKVRVLYCAYCNTGTRVADHASREDAVKAMVAHDVVCRQNPLVQRAEQAEHAAAFDLMQAKSRHEADVATIQRVMRERDEARGTREQAEAALAQAQAERDEAQCQIPTEQPPDRLKQGRLILNGYGRTCYLAGIETGKREAAEAQPPALPPLPEGWVEKHVNGKRTEAEVRFTYLDEGGCDVQIYAMADAVRFWQVGTVPSVADLITVLRHAERAHQRLKEGQ